VDFEFLRPEVNAAFSYEQMAAGHPSTIADVQVPRDQGKITDWRAGSRPDLEQQNDEREHEMSYGRVKFWIPTDDLVSGWPPGQKQQQDVRLLARLRFKTDVTTAADQFDFMSYTPITAPN
jgi:hypothetical protein